jgi:hypothetical protein
MTDYYNLYTLVKDQNQTLKENIVDNQNKFSTDDQLFNYIGADMNQLINTNHILFVLYYILFAGVVIVLFISPKNTFSIYLKFVLIFVLGIFPFVYLWIELKIWEWIKYMGALFTGYVYNKGDDGRSKILM